MQDGGVKAKVVVRGSSRFRLHELTDITHLGGSDLEIISIQTMKRLLLQNSEPQAWFKEIRKK